MGETRYDLVILGASGFTGQFVLEEIARLSRTNKGRNGEALTFAIAGRNTAKLEKALQMTKENTDLNVSNVPVLIADVGDVESLNAMASKAKVVINCVGPYRFYGEAIVRACVENGADHVDISGEPQYLEHMQLLFNDLAQEKGVHVVGSCGFDSVPADLGTIFLQDNFGGDVNGVEMIVGGTDDSKGNSSINFTTMECAVHGLSHKNELKSVRRQLFPNPLPKPPVKLAKRGVLWYSKEANRWCVPNMMSDRSVVLRSQRYFHTAETRRPCLFEAYFGNQSWLQSAGAILFGIFFGLMASFGFTRKLLLQYPEILTFGMFTRAGPPRETLENLKFEITLVGTGWDSTLKDLQKQHDEKPNRKVIAKVTGPDPGYFGTAILISQCALTLLQEKSKLPQPGGVYTPGGAFCKSSLLKRLEERDIKFTIPPLALISSL